MVETFEFNLTMAELEKITHKDYLITKKFLKADAPEFLALAPSDKKALRHLCKAAEILEKINMQIDCKHNLEVKEFLAQEVKKGNKQAKLTKILFDAQKGCNALDTMSEPINLIKGIAFLIIATILSSILELHIVNYILTSFMTYGVILLIVIFQPEIRRALEQLRNK